MSISVMTPTAELSVAPGQSVSTELTVHNSSQLVEEFTFAPLGAASEWIAVDPPALRLFPETNGIVTVTIAPPRAPTTKPGPTAWGVKTVPHNDPENGAVAEGTVIVGPYSEIVAELQPSVSRSRFRGRFDVAVDNRGNVPVVVRVETTNAEQALRFDAKPTSFDAKPGTATFSRLNVKPLRRIWRGQAKPHPVEVLVSAAPSPQDELAEDVAIASVVLTGTYAQEPVIPKSLLKAVLLAAALLIALFILWKTLLKPIVQSTARDVAIEEADAVDQQIADLAEAVDAQEQLADEAAAAVDEATAAVDEQLVAADQAAAEAEEKVDAAVEELDDAINEVENAPAGLLADTSNPTNFRLTVAAPVGQSSANASPVNPPDTTFALTDIILQNPGGDVGRLRVVIGGEPIIESALENFRDLDFHFISPYLVNPGSNVSIELDCAVDQLLADDPCEAAVSFAGFTTTDSPEEG